MRQYGGDVRRDRARHLRRNGQRPGYVVELAIPRERINVAADRILFNAVLHDAAGDDTFTGLAAGNYDKWLPVELKLPAEPVTEPEPGADDDNGRGPGWSNGEEVNPWK